MSLFSVLLYSLGCTLCILSIYAMSTNAFYIFFYIWSKLIYQFALLVSENWAKNQKGLDIFYFLKAKQFQICFLQESHSTPEIEKKTWTVDNTYDFYFSGRSSNSGGICKMADKALDYNVKEHTEIIPRKLQALRVKMFDHKITYINIYGPNSDDEVFFF